MVIAVALTIVFSTLSKLIAIRRPPINPTAAVITIRGLILFPASLDAAITILSIAITALIAPTALQSAP